MHRPSEEAVPGVHRTGRGGAETLYGDLRGAPDKAGRTLVPIERNAGRRRLMLSLPFGTKPAQNGWRIHRVFMDLYARGKKLLAAQSVQNGIGRFLPS